MHKSRGPLIRKSKSLGNYGYTCFHGTTYPVFHGMTNLISQVVDEESPRQAAAFRKRTAAREDTARRQRWTRDRYSI